MHTASNQKSVHDKRAFEYQSMKVRPTRSTSFWSILPFRTRDSISYDTIRTKLRNGLYDDTFVFKIARSVNASIASQVVVFLPSKRSPRESRSVLSAGRRLPYPLVASLMKSFIYDRSPPFYRMIYHHSRVPSRGTELLSSIELRYLKLGHVEWSPRSEVGVVCRQLLIIG